MGSKNPVLSLKKVLHPELQTRDDIIQILETYCISFDIKSYSHDELLNLFNRIALPLPQRQYDNSRRGKFLMALRAKEENKVDSNQQINGKADSNSERTEGTNLVSNDNESIKRQRRRSEENCDSNTKKSRSSRSPPKSNSQGPPSSSGRIILKRAPLPSQEKGSSEQTNSKKPKS